MPGARADQGKVVARRFGSPDVLIGVVAAVLAWCGATPARSQDVWPSRPVKLVIPFAAGGATDTLGRVLAQAMAADLGQPIVVENRLGAAGMIGSDAVAKSVPDGYMLLLGTSSTHSILPQLSARLPFDPIVDFTPISQVAEGGSLLVVAPNLPVANVSELVAFAKSAPAALNYASSGVGSIPHLMGAHFAGLAGIRMQHVPYKGSSLSYADLRSGQVQLLFDSLVTALPQVRAGNVRALAITSASRSPQAPDIPTMAETGLPSFTSMTWFGILGPKGMDPRLIRRIEGSIQKGLRSETVKLRYGLLGLEASANGREAFARTIASESDKWKQVISEQKIDAE